MKTHCAAIYERFNVDFRCAVHLATETEFGIFFSTGNAGFGFTQRGCYLFGVVSNRGYNPHTRYDHTPHRVLLYTCSV
jgi:hypothetical protein